MSTAFDKKRALRSGRGVSSMAARGWLVVALAFGLAAGVLATAPEASAAAVEAAGIELTRLLRAMAGLKMLLGAAAVAAVWWRLGSAAAPGWVLAYGVAGGAMMAGPGLIWMMVHVGLGALLLHGGLFATVGLLWRDPGSAGRLAELVAMRRTRQSVG